MVLVWIALSMLWMQTGVDAGPALTSCESSMVTLVARPINPPANYVIEWEGAVSPNSCLVVNPNQTTQYRVFLTNLDTNEVFEDTTWVLVHPTNADVFPDMVYDELDWLAFFAEWQTATDDVDFDPDNDGLVSVLDWFYFCNFNQNPVNTPPRLTIGTGTTYRNTSQTITFQIEDDEQTPSLVIARSPDNGAALLVGGQLYYDPDTDFVGEDSFEVYVTDGFIRKPNVTVNVTVLEPETWSNLYNDIFLVQCKACHIDAASGNLSLATYSSAQQGGFSGAGFIVGSPAQSPIYLRVENGTMPLMRPMLSTEDIERIRLWIELGANP